MPYHIGNGWGGGLVPIITSSAFLSTDSLGWALVYPIALPAVMFLICYLFFMPETRRTASGRMAASLNRQVGMRDGLASFVLSSGRCVIGGSS